MQGALNDRNDPWQIKRDAHAVQYYESIKNSDKSDIISKLVKVSGIRKQSIEKVYDHVFINRYLLDDGVARFIPSYDMAQSFQRLLTSDGKYARDCDIIMLKYERLEYELMDRYGYDYKSAHALANKKYNYESMV